MTRREAEVLITDAYTECNADEDCRLVSTSCNSCCQLGAIHSSLEATYEPNREAACADYRGGECDCDLPNASTRCVQGRCGKYESDAQSCFGPWQNPERAEQADALGCRCFDDMLPLVCIGDTTFLCIERVNFPGSAKFWKRQSATECLTIIHDETCERGRQYDTGPECANEFLHCYDLPNGRWC